MKTQKLNELSANEIKQTVAEKYSEVATTPGAKFNFPVGRKFAESVGYLPDLLDTLPVSMSESFTGAGNPQPFVEPLPGEIRKDMNDWFRCIGGALPQTEFLSRLYAAGFVETSML